MQKGVAVAYHRLLYFILFIYHYYFFLENFFLQAPVKVRGESLQTTIRKNKKK